MLSEAQALWLAYADNPGSHYFRADHLTESQTAEAVARELCRTLVLVAKDAEADHALAPEDIDALHSAVFGPVFGDLALDRRSLKDHVEYPVWIEDRQSIRTQMAEGSAPKQIDRNIERAFARFEKQLLALSEREQLTLVDLCLPPAQLYADLIRVHPFMDGNGRTAWLVMNHALVRCGALIVTAAPTIESRVVLGKALAGKHPDARPLARHLAETIKKSDKSKPELTNDLD